MEKTVMQAGKTIKNEILSHLLLTSVLVLGFGEKK